MQYLVSTPLEFEGTYPYEARLAGCRYHGQGVARLSGGGYYAVRAYSPSSLAAAVNGQPVSVLLDASQNIF